MAESLPDSGGAYFDADSGGVSGIARRWYSQGKNSFVSGDAANLAVGFAGASALIAGAKYVRDSMDI